MKNKIEYKKILVPYDSSKPSDNALSHAIQIAKMSRSSNKIVYVILLHVIQEIHLPATFKAFTTSYNISQRGDRITFKEYFKQLYHEMKASAIKMLDNKIQKYKNNKEDQITLQGKVTVGYPPDQIIEFANEEDVDLIIMGTTGLVGFAKIKALGSVARNVSEKAKCPVMLVR